MIVTIEEAKTKWCPFAREGGYQTGSRNRSGLQPSDWPHCAADACMAWRWWNEPRDEAKHKGYCGLVGKEAA